MWTAEADPDYAAQSVARRMRFYYKSEFVIELDVGHAEQHRSVLEYWAHLKVSPERTLKVPEVIKDYIGCTLADIALDSDGKTLLIRGNAAGVI